MRLPQARISRESSEVEIPEPFVEPTISINDPKKFSMSE